MPVIFHWDKESIYELLETCNRDETRLFIKRYFKPGSQILESGCGAGRYVKYLSDLGYKVIGLEFNSETVQLVKKVWPELDIVQGDAVSSPFSNESFDGVLSLGVLEHWIEGPALPLHDIYRVLKAGGHAIIQVPCLNYIRVIKKYLWIKEMMCLSRIIARALIKHDPLKQLTLNRFHKNHKYVVEPAIGEFYEYHMTPDQFKSAICEVGFDIIEHCATDHLDGFYHELNLLHLIRWKHHRFYTPFIIHIINEWLKKKYPYFHCHMQLAVVRKP